MGDKDSFETLKRISKLTRFSDDEEFGRDQLIRFLDTFNGDPSLQPIVDSLCIRFGLYPYLSDSGVHLGMGEALAAELHMPPELHSSGFSFHSAQQQVYERLMDGNSVILSAPTSFGKSVVIDALIASHKWSNIVLIVPTIALIDETRRRLASYRDSYRIVTGPTEDFGERNVLIMTQERFMDLDKLPAVDFFMIDEFYKLGAGKPQDSRRTLLNLAWNRLLRTGAQYYLTGPNVDHLDDRLPEDIRASLVHSEFRPVAVDIEDRSTVPDQRADLIQLILSNGGTSTLVFTGSPKKASNLAVDLAESLGRPTEEFTRSVADWLGSSYDSQWDVVTALRAGVGLHTGPLPRSVQRVMIRLFNDGLIETLVCTSTLIEGVNTSAKTVVIYEKKIDGQLIDFFTFNNIRGRAGRMFRHYVGNVITYMPPPEVTDTTVDIPLETQSDLASDADLVQIEEEDLDEESFEKISHVLEQDLLSLSTIRKNRGYDPSLQIEAAQKMSSLPHSKAAQLSWTGYPSVSEAKATLEFAFEQLLLRPQRRGMNFSMLWGRLQNARSNSHDFSREVDQQMMYARPNQTRSEVVDDVLRFHRNWIGFTIPSMLRATQAIQSEVLGGGDTQAANYENLIRELEANYLPSGLAELEEYGLPTPLGQKLLQRGLDGSTLTERLDNLVRLARDPAVLVRLSDVERWILSDVVIGITGPQ